MPYGITRGRGTPPATRREQLQFELLVTPAVRIRSIWLPPSSVGDVLDTEPTSDICMRRIWWASSDGRMGARPLNRQSYDCPVCVPALLVERCAGAWALWAGTATVMSFQTKQHSTKQSPGRLRIPQPGDDYVVFEPGGSTQGDELNRELVEALRAMPLPPRPTGGGLPNPWRGFLPEWLSFDAADLLASQHGFRLVRQGKTWRCAGPVDPEAVREWVAEVWNR